MHSSFLRYLDEVAKQGSIRKAAAVLNVTSTSVNRNILNTEERLGIKLFDRSSGGVELTAAGKIVLEHCRRTLYEFAKVQAEIDDIRDLRIGHLSIQTVDSVTFSVLPRILDRFSDKFPGISLSVTAATPDDITTAVVAGEADIGITFTKDLRPELRVLSEKAAPFGIIVRPDHPLAERINVSVNDLLGYTLVRTIDARGRHSILDQEIESMTVAMSTQLFTNALTIAKQAIQTNRFIGIYTKIGFIEEIEAGAVKFVPLAVKALSEYKIGAIISASVGITPAKHLFLNAVDQTFRALNFGI